MASPLHSRLGFGVYAVWFGFWLAPHHSWLGFWGVCACVCASPVPRRSRLGCAVWVAVLGLGFRLRPTTPGSGVHVCVCVFVCASRLVPCPSWLGVRYGGVCLGLGCSRAPPLLARMLGRVYVCVRALLVPRPSWMGRAVWACVPVLGFRLLSATPGWGVRVCVCSCVCLASTPPFLAGWCVCVCVGLGFVHSLFFSWLGCCSGVASCLCRVHFSSTSFGGRLWRGGVRELPWVGFVPPPPPPHFFFQGCRGGVWFLALLCRGFVGSVSGCPGLRSCGLCPPFPSRLGCAFVFFFCPSPPQRGVCWRVRGVLSSGAPLHSIGCRRFWLGGPPVFLLGALWVPFLVPSGLRVDQSLVVQVGRFVAVGLSRIPPFFFRGAVCLFLPLQSLGWCTHWSAFRVVNRVAVGVCVLLGLPPAPAGGCTGAAGGGLPGHPSGPRRRVPVHILAGGSWTVWHGTARQGAFPPHVSWQQKPTQAYYVTPGRWPSCYTPSAPPNKQQEPAGPTPPHWSGAPTRRSIYGPHGKDTPPGPGTFLTSARGPSRTPARQPPSQWPSEDSRTHSG